MDDLENVRYQCPKCGASKCRTGHFKAYEEEDSSGIFDVQRRITKKFYTVICACCGFTEMYEARANKNQNILDFLGND